MNLSFWNEKKVFITGHTGFKGSWLSLWLQQLGVQVVGYALQPPTKPSLFEVAQVAQGMTSIIGDVRDGTKLRHSMQQAAPDIVIHMAAQPLVRHSYVDPVETYSTNVMGTIYMLEAARQTPSVRAIVNVTTDKCYENKEWVWGYRENEPMGGSDPYSSSKGCAELVTAAYRNSFFNSLEFNVHQVSLATARAGNVIGGGDWAKDRLIPDILRAIQSGENVNIRNPNATRPWQYVLEPLSGYLALAEKLYTQGPAFSEAFNFGPDEEDTKSVRWIVEKLTQQWGVGAIWKQDHEEHPYEAHHLKLDCSKSKMLLNWQPRWTLSQALENIIAWHNSYQDGDDMYQISLMQIASFQNHVA